jgi:hypothetical protein
MPEIFFPHGVHERSVAPAGETERYADFYCYVSLVLTTLKTLRYTKRICTLAGLQIMARKHKSEKAPIWILECMISQL